MDRRVVKKVFSTPLISSSEAPGPLSPPPQAASADAATSAIARTVAARDRPIAQKCIAVDHPVALVTGANRGIGAEIARQLAADHDFVVFAGARDPRRCRGEATDRFAVELDVTDEDEIYAALEWIGSDPGRLDALVNNAGVYGDPVGAADYDIDRAAATFWRSTPSGPGG